MPVGCFVLLGFGGFSEEEEGETEEATFLCMKCPTECRSSAALRNLASESCSSVTSRTQSAFPVEMTTCACNTEFKIPVRVSVYSY